MSESTSTPIRSLLAPRSVLADAYQIRFLLGEGGMGQVYEARDLALNRLVAVKVAWPDIGADALLAEARVMAAFHHPSLVAVHAFGRHHESPFVVMERLFGHPLAEHIDQAYRFGNISVEESVSVMSGIAKGLEVLHNANLVHRDLKPANVMLVPPGRVVLLDFGIVRQERHAASDEYIEGTPEYLAPEAGKGTVRAGRAYLCDIYALGIIGFELLVGRVPFHGATAIDTVERHVSEPVPDLTTLRKDAPDALLRLVEQMMAKNPEDRPSTIESVVARLRAIRSTLDVSVEPEPLSVLVIDADTTHVQRTRNTILHAVPGVTVEAATTADEALAAFSRQPPNIAILELGLPSMNGLELYLHLDANAMGEDTSFIVTGATDSDQHLLRRLGVRDFLAKGPEFGPHLSALMRRLGQGQREVISTVRRLRR